MMSRFVNLCKKVKVAHTRIAEHRVPELILVLGSQPAGDVSHKPGGRLPLLSARPAVTLTTLKRAATSFTAWWTEARWVWTVYLRLLPDSVAAAIWTRAFCTGVQHANHSATEPPTYSHKFYVLIMSPLWGIKRLCSRSACPSVCQSLSVSCSQLRSSAF